MIAALFCICGATVFTASSSDNNDNLNHRWEGNDGAEYRSPFYATFQMTKVMNSTGGQRHSV